MRHQFVESLSSPKDRYVDDEGSLIKDWDFDQQNHPLYRIYQLMDDSEVDEGAAWRLMSEPSVPYGDKIPDYARADWGPVEAGWGPGMSLSVEAIYDIVQAPWVYDEEIRAAVHNQIMAGGGKLPCNPKPGGPEALK